jgi:hypothetical protein
MFNIRTEFLRAYSRLPIPTRDEVIVIIDDKPLTWDVAYIEVSGETKLGMKILKKLLKMNILGDKNNGKNK